MHFTVLTFLRDGESLEEKLWPYYSQMSEIDDPNNEHLLWNYSTHDLDDHDDYNDFPSREALIEALTNDKIKIEEDRIYHFNGKGEWDWWVPGGRYDGRLMTLSGDMVNSCAITDLNLIGLEKKAVKEWEGFYEIGHLLLSEKQDKSSRQLLWNQMYKEFPDKYKSPWINTDEFFKYTKDEYYYIKKLQALTSFAMLDLEGNWTSIDYEGDDELEWSEKIRAYIEEHKDNEEVNVVMVDCHN